MGAVPMDNSGPRNKRLVERNNCAWDEHKGDRNVVVDKGQGLGLSEEGESKINGVAEGIYSGSGGVIHVPSGPEKPKPQGSVIHWDRFLPKRSLKILLVENDDSTRHVVCALLRNCSYEVTAVENGLQAWKTLEDMTNHIDIILTEVAMPILSGIDLLCKIMSHKTFKNIPVIMTSSHDSMGLVFKCLSNGAVDFLVKPIRKNELKNLWQHVWRRCHSSSGSGSESATQPKIYAKLNSDAESENNISSSDEHDNVSIGLSLQEGSDNGSGTQSSCTKRATKIDSPQPVLPWAQSADTPDSTCAQVIHTKPETFSCRWVPITETKEFREQDEQLDNVAMGKDLEIGVSRNPDTHLEYQHKFSTHPSSKRQDKSPEPYSLPFKKGQPEHKSENVRGKQKDHSINSVSAIGSCTNPQMESQTLEAPKDLSDVSQIKDKASSDFRELPPLELTIQRLRGVGDLRTSVHDDRNVLRHSDLSAFSKYKTASSADQAPTGNAGRCSPLDNCSVTMKTETMHNSNDTAPKQQSNGSINNNDLAATTKYDSVQAALYDKSESVSAFKCLHSSAFQSVQNGRACAAQQLTPGKADGMAVSTDQVHAKGSNQQVQVQHHHHHYHHHHHHVHNMQHQSQLDHDELPMKNMTADASQCGSSNMLGGPLEVEGNAVYYSVNGSASGSKHGSNERNGSSNDFNAGVTNMESDNGAMGNSGVIHINGTVGGSGAHEDRLAQREAALTKFRQKRKERCFEKKVRYQSRKRLAEQRPRIRGQFVRHIGSDTKSGNDKQDSFEDNSGDTVL